MEGVNRIPGRAEVLNVVMNIDGMVALAGEAERNVNEWR